MRPYDSAQVTSTRTRITGRHDPLKIPYSTFGEDDDEAGAHAVFMRHVPVAAPVCEAEILARPTAGCLKTTGHRPTGSQCCTRTVWDLLVDTILGHAPYNPKALDDTSMTSIYKNARLNHNVRGFQGLGHSDMRAHTQRPKCRNARNAGFLLPGRANRASSSRISIQRHEHA